MSASSRPSDSASTPMAHGPARIPADLASSERALAGWMGALARTEGDAGLQDRIIAAALLAAPAADSKPGIQVGSSAYRWIAVAAAAVLAIGVGLALWSGDGAGSASIQPAGLSSAEGAQHASNQAVGNRTEKAPVWVMDDPDLVLYHDFETFDGLGRDRQDLLALDDR